MNSPNIHPNSFQQPNHSPEKQSVSPRLAGTTSQPPDISIDMAKNYAMDMLDRRNTQTGFGKHEDQQPLHSEAAGPVLPPHASGLNETSDHQQDHSHPTEVIHPETTQELGEDAVEAGSQAIRHRSGSYQGLPNKTLSQTDNLAPKSAPPSNAEDAQTPSSGGPVPVSINEETCIDYGTVRVRPEKARYEDFSPGWSSETTSSHLTEEQATQLQITSQGVEVLSTQVTNASDVNQGDQGRQTTIQDSGDVVARHENEDSNDDHDVNSSDTNTHPKRKVGEAYDGSRKPSQMSPKQKVAKIAPSDETSQEASSSQANPQHTEHVQDTNRSSHSEGNNNVNDGNKSQTDDDVLAAKSHEGLAFNPTIDASQLPSYPGQAAQATESQAIPQHHPNPRGNGMATVLPVSGTSQSPKPEPFPVYRDLMSGPHIPSRGNRERATQQRYSVSISNNASTIIQDPHWRPNELTLGAQRFVPFPPHPGPGFMIPVPQQASAPGKLFDWKHSTPAPNHVVAATQDSKTKKPLQTQKEYFTTSTFEPIEATRPQSELQKTATASSSKEEEPQKSSDKHVSCEDEGTPVTTDKDGAASTGSKQGNKKASHKAKNRKRRDTRKNTSQTLPEQIMEDSKAEKEAEKKAEQDQREPEEKENDDKGKGKGKEKVTPDSKRPASRTSLRTGEASGRSTPIPTPTSTTSPSDGESSKAKPWKSKTRQASEKNATADANANASASADAEAEADVPQPSPAPVTKRNNKKSNNRKGHNKKSSDSSSRSQPRSRAPTPSVLNPKSDSEAKPQAQQSRSRSQSPKAQASTSQSSPKTATVTVDVLTTTTTATTDQTKPGLDNNNNSNNDGNKKNKNKKGHKKKKSSQGSSRSNARSRAPTPPNVKPDRNNPTPEPKPQSKPRSPEARALSTSTSSSRTLEGEFVPATTSTATATAAAPSKSSVDSSNDKPTDNSSVLQPQREPTIPPTTPSDSDNAQPQPQPRQKTKKPVPKLAPIPLRTPGPGPWRGPSSANRAAPAPAVKSKKLDDDRAKDREREELPIGERKGG